MEDGEALDDRGAALSQRDASAFTQRRQGVFAFVESDPLPIVPVAAGFVVGLGGVAELVGGGLVLSGLAAPLADGEPLGAGEVLGADEPGVVGVHATIAVTAKAAAMRRRGCERYMSQLLRNGEVERHGRVARASGCAKGVRRASG